MTLEFSLAFPILLLLSLGMIVLGQGVSQYQLVSILAREGARYASVRGPEYQATTGHPVATQADVINNAILPRASGFAPGTLNTTVLWATDANKVTTVSVAVSYRWVPSAYLSPVTMASTSVMVVNY